MKGGNADDPGGGSEWGPRIKRIRKQLRLTQSEFGKRLGVKPVQVSRWENSSTIVPRPAVRSQILMLEAYPLSEGRAASTGVRQALMELKSELENQISSLEFESTSVLHRTQQQGGLAAWGIEVPEADDLLPEQTAEKIWWKLIQDIRDGVSREGYPADAAARLRWEEGRRQRLAFIVEYAESTEPLLLGSLAGKPNTQAMYFLQLSLACGFSGQHQKGLEKISQGLKVEGANARWRAVLHQNISWLKQRLGLYLEAIEAADEALRLLPGDTSILYTQLNAYSLKHDAGLDREMEAVAEDLRRSEPSYGDPQSHRSRQIREDSDLEYFRAHPAYAKLFLENEN